MKSPVLAFLQNAWFRPETPRVIIDRYLSDQEYRRKVLANCMTGRRLKQAFGERYGEIWWENASASVATIASGAHPASAIHMTNIIQDVKPMICITFGKVATDAYELLVSNLGQAVPMYHAFPHPNARGIHQSQLDEFARVIISKYFSSPN